MLPLVLVVDVKTTEADVIANTFVVDVMTTCYSIRRCLFLADVIVMYICG